MSEKPTSSWYIRHDYQRHDIYRGAQNAANQTGVPQFVYRMVADDEEVTDECVISLNEDLNVVECWVVENVVTYEEVRATAGNPGGKYNWEVHG